MMRLSLSIPATLLLLLCLVCLSPRILSKTILEEADERSIEPVAEQEKPIENARTRYSLLEVKVLNFDRFKRVFKRTYSTFLEEMARKRLFLARAFRAFLSLVAYKYGAKSSYLAINDMSDRTPGEIKRLYVDKGKFVKGIEAKFKDINIEEDMKNGPTDGSQNVIPAIDESEIEENLELCARNPDEPGFKEIMQEIENAKPRRRKRSSDSVEPKRYLNMDDLFREPTKSSDSQLTDKVPSNNPNYVPPELRSFGGDEDGGILSYMPDNLAKMIANAPGFNIAANLIKKLSSKFSDDSNAPPNNQANSRGVFVQVSNGPPIQLMPNQQGILDNQPSPMQIRQQEALKKYEESFNRQKSSKRKCYKQQSIRGSPSPASTSTQPLSVNPFLDGVSPTELPDKVFKDHRESGCILEVRRQRDCGACYAFATIALYEWTYCNQTKNRAAFSEQYVVDCGKEVGLDGCDGGVFTTVADFVLKFGLELRSNYPYREKSDECPYEREQIEQNPQIMGYLRMDEQYFKTIKITEAENTLKDRPFVINQAINSQFSEYGGGVDDHDTCGQDSFHSMLVIGHGREDGKEYWLIRNSHGVHWGEQGYYKLNKKSPCIYPKFGFILEARFEPDTTKNMNKDYDAQKIKRRYWDYMKLDIEKSAKRSRSS